MRSIHPKIRLKLGGALAAGGICLLCGFFSVGLFSEPEIKPVDPLESVAGARSAVRIESPQGQTGAAAMEVCLELLSEGGGEQDFQLLTQILGSGPAAVEK